MVATAVGVVPVKLAVNGCLAGLSASRTTNGTGFEFASSTFDTATGPPVTPMLDGKSATFTVGVPVMPTFQLPLCCAATVPVTGRGSGLVMLTGAPPAPA